MTDQMDIGHEFAIRWLCKNHPMSTSKNQPPVDEVDICQDIASAANTYADKKRAEFEVALRKVMMGVLDKSHTAETVLICEKDFLESDCMQFVARKLLANQFTPARRFPTDLGS